MAKNPTVGLFHCDSYDPDKIRRIVGSAMADLELAPAGRILIKPNGVIAHHHLFPDACTRAEVVDGILGACLDRSSGQVSDLAVGECCGITMPTRMVFREAGYLSVLRKHRARACYFDEAPQVLVQLRQPGRLRDYLYTPAPVANADFFINAPKFKSHPWTTLTCALKNMIGVQDDRHRLIDHDYHLNYKIADIQEIITPKLIVVDAIEAGELRMLTPIPFRLNLILVGNNQVAMDAVAARILGLDPRAVDHVRLCHERGFGPIDLEEIRITGDVSLDQAEERGRGFRSAMVRSDEYFEGTPIRVLAGRPPDDRHDYCWGGCPGVLQESIEVLRRVDSRTDQRCRPLVVVFGAYNAPLEVTPEERVLFIGDCASWEGEIHGKQVSIRSAYQSIATKDPHKARHADVLVKMARGFLNVIRHAGSPWIRVGGCPVSVAEQILYLSLIGKTANPYFRPTTVLPFFRSYFDWRLHCLLRRMRGKRYHQPLPQPCVGPPQLPTNGS